MKSNNDNYSRQLAFQLTWRCNLRCAHCFQDHVNENLSVDKAKEIIDGFHCRDLIDMVTFTGGEIFLRYEDLSTLVEYSTNMGLETAAITNARWCSTEAMAYDKLGTLKEKGLTHLGVSLDTYHLEFVAENNYHYLLKVANEIALPIRITLVSDKNSERSKILLKELERDYSFNTFEQFFMPVGNAKQLCQRAEYIDFEYLLDPCTGQNACTVFPDGRALPCCSVGTHESLSAGSFMTDSVDNIIDKLQENELHCQLRQEGPIGVLFSLPKQKQLEFFGQEFTSICHLCNSLMNDPEVLQVVKKEKYTDGCKIDETAFRNS